MAFLGAIFFGFVPAFLFACFLYWLDRYEKEPLPLLGVGFVRVCVAWVGSVDLWCGRLFRQEFRQGFRVCQKFLFCRAV